MIFLEKKPNGYVYTDLYKKKCFENIRDIIATGTYKEFKREYDSSESVIFVTSKYFDYVNSLITTQPFVQNIVEASDDYISENIFKIANILNDNNHLYDVYMVVNTTPYSEDEDIYLSVTKGYLINKKSFNDLLVAAGIPTLS